MIADDVTPFGPSEVADAMVAVVPPVALAVVVVVEVLLAAEIADAAISTKATPAVAAMITRRCEPSAPRILLTLPPRCCARRECSEGSLAAGWHERGLRVLRIPSADRAPLLEMPVFNSRCPSVDFPTLLHF
jgi:hypothetical protein